MRLAFLNGNNRSRDVLAKPGKRPLDAQIAGYGSDVHTGFDILWEALPRLQDNSLRNSSIAHLLFC